MKALPNNATKNKKLPRLDLYISVILLITELLILGRVIYAWNEYVPAARTIWSIVAVLVGILFVLNCLRLRKQLK